MLAELPDVFPLLRDIQHVIDCDKVQFVKSSALQNEPHWARRAEEVGGDDLLRKGFIRESLSPCVVPALLTPKKYGSWRMCVDSQTINRITLKYKFPISRLDKLC